MEFKTGDKVFIRWKGGNSGEYIPCEYHGKCYIEDSLTGEPNIIAVDVFVDTEIVELVDD